jgi:transposase
MNRLSRDEIIAVLKEKKAGATNKELVEKYGVGESTISNWNNKYKHELNGARKTSKPKKKIAPNPVLDNKQIIAALKERRDKIDRIIELLEQE